jgi:streptogramin lyase
MDTLPSGELVMSSDGGGVVIVDPYTAGTRRIASNVYGIYGVDVGPDGLIYVGNRTSTYRVDPVSGDATMYIANNEAQSVGFSPDGSKFYFTKTFGYALWQVDVDANYDPIGPPSQLADFGASYRDGLALDICGNIYVTDYGTGQMFRTDPTTGAHITYVNFTPFSNYGHSAMFGSGIGGWLSDAIYVPQPYNNNTVGEIVTGVPGFTFP